MMIQLRSIRPYLLILLTAAEALLAGATEGTAPGNYVVGSKATLQTTIDAVQVIYDNPASTQANIDAAVVNLHNAMEYIQGFCYRADCRGKSDCILGIR